MLCSTVLTQSTSEVIFTSSVLAANKTTRKMDVMHCRFSWPLQPFDGLIHSMSMIWALAVTPMRHPGNLLPGHEGDKLPQNSAVLSATACYSRINPLVRFHCPLAFMVVMTLCIILKMPRLNDFRGNRECHLKPGTTRSRIEANMELSKFLLKIITLIPWWGFPLYRFTPPGRMEEWTEMVDLKIVLIFHNDSKGQLHLNMNFV